MSRLIDRLLALPVEQREQFTLSLPTKERAKLIEALDEEIRAECEESLRGFISHAWHVIEPISTPLVWGWPLDAICEHLEAVARGDINRLLINVPPGFLKSLSTCVFFPAWMWGPQSRPQERFLAFSYSNHLTVRDNLRCRRLITSNWFQSLWGDRFSLVSDQNAKIKFENDHTGWKIASSVSGTATGERGDFLILDDLNNVKEGESEAETEGVRLFVNEVLPSRVNNPEKSAIISIAQRVSGRDASSELLEEALPESERTHEYTHLMIPMRFEEDRKSYTSIGWEDPRTVDGELAFPARFPEKVLIPLERRMGAYGTAAQHQQRPAPRGGGLFKRDDFRYVENLDELGVTAWRLCRHWDLAATERLDNPDSAWTAGVLVGVGPPPDNKVALIDAVHGQWSASEVERTIKRTAEMDRQIYGDIVRVSIPQDPGAAGKAWAQSIVRLLSGFTVEAKPETGDKVRRAEPLSAQTEIHNVWLVRGAWNHRFLGEADLFPRGRTMDLIDAAANAFNVASRMPEPLIGFNMDGLNKVSEWKNVGNLDFSVQ